MKVYHFQQMGKRTTQEDHLAIEATLGLFIVADGMGGAAKGEVASQTVVDCLVAQGLRGHSFVDEPALQTAVQASLAALSARLITHPQEEGAGTTLALLSFNGSQALIAHLGDSRVYHIRPREAYFWHTKDHTLVQELFDLGVIETEMDKKKHPQRNQLTKVLQARKQPKAMKAAVGIVNTLPGDIFMLCSDGVLEPYLDSEFRALWEEEQFQLATIVERIRTQCLKESTDNNTAIFLELETKDFQVR